MEKVWNLVPKNLYKPCDDIKIDGTNVHDQIAFYAFHLCQACTTYIILQLGDEDYKFLLSPTIKYYFCFSKKDKINVSFLLTDAFIYPFYPGVYQKSEELCSQVFSWG